MPSIHAVRKENPEPNPRSPHRSWRDDVLLFAFFSIVLFSGTLLLAEGSVSAQVKPPKKKNTSILTKKKAPAKPTPKPVVHNTPKKTYTSPVRRVVRIAPTPAPTPKPTPTPDPNRPPRIPKPGEDWSNPKDGAILVWIPSGDFVRGSDNDDPDAKQEEKPQKKVSLEGFWMYKNLVTVAQYEKFCKATGRQMPEAPDFNPGWGKKDHPIVNVSWEDADAYCTWAGSQLPTEAQWERAARGDEARKYPWGNDFDSNKLWCSIQEAKDAGGTAAVFRTNRVNISPFGIRDMAGNVFQWCADWWEEGYYANAPTANPTGPISGTARVLRGGSWFNNTQATFRTTNRVRASPQGRETNRGFRAVMPPTPVPAPEPN